MALLFQDPVCPCPKNTKARTSAWVEAGCENLVHHIETVKKAGINPVVCINSFYTDTKDEIAAVRRLSEAAGARVAVSQHWLKGGDGALEFADAVVDACEEKNEFKLLYDLSMPLRQRIELIAKEVYGADGVSYTPEAEAKAKKMEADPELVQAGNLHGEDAPQPVPRSEHKGRSQGMDPPHSETFSPTMAPVSWFRLPEPFLSCREQVPTRHSEELTWTWRPERSKASSS